VDRPDLDRMTEGLRRMTADPEDRGDLPRICKRWQESLASSCSGGRAP
jgi:hypothetical protein